MPKLGLIGYPLGHSFSKNYFTEKFQQEGIQQWTYESYPLPDAQTLPQLWASEPALVGLNVTIPHKQAVLPFCQQLDPLAERIGAVNTILKHPNGTFTGYNSDYFGFRYSLERWMGPAIVGKQALILGTGGAAKALQVALQDMAIPYQYVSRTAAPNYITYQDLHNDSSILANHQLLINATPLGTFPNIDRRPDVPYEQLTASHWLYDLVYNPATTAFMQGGMDQKSRVKNGLDMLIGQAEKSWEIWRQAYPTV